MNTKRLVAITAGLLLVSGCASMKSPIEKDRGMSPYDAEYVGAVNATARERGTHVIWINPPRAKVDENAGQ